MSGTRRLCAAGVAVAVIFLLTSFTKVPIPLGYAHLGDAAIFLAALFLPRKEAALAAGIGSALADVIGGFPLWAAPTFVIKYGMADVVSRVAGTERKLLSLPALAGFLLSSLWLTVGYVAAGAFLYDSWEAAMTSAPGLLMEGAVNTAAAMAAGILLERVGFRV